MIALAACLPLMLVHPMPSHKLALSRPSYACAKQVVHSVELRPLRGLMPSPELLALVSGDARAAAGAGLSPPDLQRVSLPEPFALDDYDARAGAGAGLSPPDLQRVSLPEPFALDDYDARAAAGAGLSPPDLQRVSLPEPFALDDYDARAAAGAGLSPPEPFALDDYDARAAAEALCCMDNATRKQTNVLLFVVWLQFLLLLLAERK